jgi:hypothetical protein
MTWGFIGAAAITAVASTQNKKGGGGGSVSFTQVPQTEEADKSRELLFGLATGEPPKVPLQKIAPLGPRTEERELARTTARELIQPQDILSLPEVQGIINEARITGDLLTNRLGRSLQASGNITSTSGRDVLGRAVTDIQKSLTASLTPFATEERRRRASLIPELERLGLTEELRKQGFTQAEFDALFQKEFTESKQLETFTIPLLQSIISLQPDIQPIVTGPGQSTFSQIAPLIGNALTAILQRGEEDTSVFPSNIKSGNF